MDLELEGKVAIVTGGSKGIGRAIALELAREGVNVAICARTQEKLETTAKELALESGRVIIPIVADMIKRSMFLHLQTFIVPFGALGPTRVIYQREPPEHSTVSEKTKCQENIDNYRIMLMYIMPKMSVVIPKATASQLRGIPKWSQRKTKARN